MKNKYKVVSLSKERKIKLLENLMEAAVNPEYLKKVSEILKRELSAEKDTEDYNNKVISSHFDKPSIVLREVGQKGIKSGDVFKIDEQISAVNQDREDLNFFYDSRRAVGTYQFFPFTWKLGQELRSHFILKTEKTDNFDSMLDEIDGLIFNFLSIDDWTLLKNAIKQSEQRIRKNNIRFLQPEVTMGELEKLTNKEIESYSIEGLDKTAVIDIRKDDHDLLSLKELISMLKGEEIHPLTIGPGFFAKYMPELLSLGVNAVVFKVTNNKLIDIKINKTENQSKFLEFSPIDSSYALVEQFCSYNKKSFFSKEVKDYKLGSLFEKETKYYVVVDGCVAAPEMGTPLSYESLSVNKEKVPAGEVFLFEEAEGEIQNTRLYFVPYNYSKLHLVHQHGSVIFGNNDQSFNSCLKNETDFFDDLTKESFLDKVEESDKILYDPAFLAAAMHMLPAGSDPEILLKPENQSLLFKAMGSLFEETNFTIEYLMSEFLSIKESGFELIKAFVKNYSPLSKRFVLGKYFEDDNGLMLDKMDTTYSLLSKKVYLDYHLNRMAINLKSHNSKADKK